MLHAKETSLLQQPQRSSTLMFFCSRACLGLPTCVVVSSRRVSRGDRCQLGSLCAHKGCQQLPATPPLPTYRSIIAPELTGRRLAWHAGRGDRRSRAGVAARRHSSARPSQRPEPRGEAGHPHCWRLSATHTAAPSVSAAHGCGSPERVSGESASCTFWPRRPPASRHTPATVQSNGKAQETRAIPARTHHDPHRGVGLESTCPSAVPQNLTHGLSRKLGPVKTQTLPNKATLRSSQPGVTLKLWWRVGRLRKYVCQSVSILIWLINHMGGAHGFTLRRPMCVSVYVSWNLPVSLSKVKIWS